MKSVIINCDPGIDDSLAIMLAVRSKKLDIACNAVFLLVNLGSSARLTT